MGARTASEAESLAWLEEHGIPVVPHRLVRGPEEAVRAAEELGFPVVMKITDTVHKSDLGGVVTNVRDEETVANTYQELVTSGAPVMVQKQMDGIELIVGARRDPSLGPSVLVGTGGILVELVQDTAVGMAPLSREQATNLLERTRVDALLGGVRGAEPRARSAVIELLVQLGRAVVDNPEISELDCNPVMVDHDRAVVVDATLVLAHGEPLMGRSEPTHIPGELFDPTSVAVVGASNDASKPGGRAINFLLDHGYTGKVFPINPNADEVRGIAAVPSIALLEEKPDLACVAVPPRHVIEIVRQAADRAVPAVIVFSAGFAESGEEGRRREEELKQLLSTHPTSPRLCGPNSIGIVSPGNRTFTAFAESLKIDDVPSGGLAFVSQSGAIGSALLSRAWGQGLGISRWISSGNEADIGVADYLAFLADDLSTRVVALFLETIRHGEAFAAAAERCWEAGKPVVAYKAGRSEAARRAIASHTGALAGSDEIFDAYLERHGVLRVNRLIELLDVSNALLTTPPPRGPRLAVLTMSGGASSVIADEAASARLELPTLSEEIQDDLRRYIPPYGAIANPVDATADAAADPSILARALEILASDPRTDILAVQLTTNADPSAAAIASAIAEVRSAIDKPILVSRLGAERLAPEGHRTYREAGIPVLTDPERLVAVAAALARYARLQELQR